MNAARHFVLRHRALLAYLILAGAMAYSISQVRAEATHRRIALAAASHDNSIAACKRGNSIRTILIGLVKDGEPALKGYRKRGLLTEKEYQAALKQNAKAKKALAPVNCVKVTTIKAA